MAFAKGTSTLMIKDILKDVSEEAILEYYTNISGVPCVTNSPLRVDNSPSFGLYYSEHGIHFKDLAKGTSGSLYDLLKEKYGFTSLAQVRDLIEKDLSKIKELDKFIVRHDKKIHSKNGGSGSNSVKTQASLNVKTRDYQVHDLEFWGKFGITEEWLRFGNIYAISHIKIGEKVFPAEKYAYCYVEFKDGNPSLKIYQPYSKRLKWLNNHDASVWDLWQQAMESDSKKLIITSSRKDALCLWANTGIPSVSLQAEGYLPKPHVVEILWSKFDEIFCFYDNDFDKEENYGRNYSNRLCEMYGFTHAEIPDACKAKDPSDLFKIVGKYQFITIVNNILKN